MALNLPPITQLRGAANCLFLSTGPQPPRRGPRRKSDDKGNSPALHRGNSLGPRQEADHVQLYPASVWHGSLKGKLRVVVLVKRKNPPTPRSLVLASTALDLDGHKLGELSGARFPIEFLFRDSNQFTGLADGQARADAVLDFPCTAALATLPLVRAEDLLAQAAPLPRVLSMARGTQRKCKESMKKLGVVWS